MHYGSDAGGSLFSNSTATSQQRNPNRRVRVDLMGSSSSSQQHRIKIAGGGNDVLGGALIEDPEQINGNAKVYLWGTRIVVEDVQFIFRKFINEFKATEIEEDENAILTGTGEFMEVDLNFPFYMEKLRGICDSEETILNLNLLHVKYFNNELYKLIIAYPSVIFKFLLINAFL